MFKLGEGFPICKMIELDIVRYLVSGSTNWLLHFGQIRSLVSISVYSLSSSHPVIVFCCSCLASSIFLGWKDLEYDSFSKRFRSSLQYAFFIRESCNGLASCRPSYSNGFGMMFGIIHHFFCHMPCHSNWRESPSKPLGIPHCMSGMLLTSTPQVPTDRLVVLFPNGPRTHRMGGKGAWLHGYVIGREFVEVLRVPVFLPCFSRPKFRT